MVIALSETLELEVSVVTAPVEVVTVERDVVEVWTERLVVLTILSQFASRW